MAKKKKQFPDRNRNIIIGSLIALVVVLLTGGGIAAKIMHDNNEKSYVASIDGEKIDIGEFKLNLFEQKLTFEYYYGADIWGYILDETSSLTAIDWAKDLAYSNTWSSNILAAKAKEYGVDFLTAEQEESVNNTLDLFFKEKYYGDGVINYIGLSEDEMRAVLSKAYYSDNLYDKVTGDLFVFDEADYDTTFVQYFEDNKNLLKYYTLNYIISDDYDQMVEALEKYNNGEDFMSLVAEYSYQYIPPAEPEESETTGESEDEADEDSKEEPEEDSAGETEETSEGGNNMHFDEETGEYVIDYSDLTVPDPNELLLLGSELTTDLQYAVFALADGDVTDIIPLYDETQTTVTDYVIFRLISSIEPDEDSTKVTYRDQYTSNKKSEIYEPIFNEWIESVEVIKNDKAYDATTIYGY